MRAVGFFKASKPTSSTIMAVELCISDTNKALLMASFAFIPYVVDALLLVRAWRRHLLQFRPPRNRSLGLSPSSDDRCATAVHLNRIQSTQEQAWRKT